MGIQGISYEGHSQARKRQREDYEDRAFVIGRYRDEEVWGDEDFEDFEDGSSKSSDEEPEMSERDSTNEEMTEDEPEQTSDEDKLNELEEDDLEIIPGNVSLNEDCENGILSKLRERKPVDYHINQSLIECDDSDDEKSPQREQATGSENRYPAWNTLEYECDQNLTDDEEIKEESNEVDADNNIGKSGRKTVVRAIIEDQVRVQHNKVQDKSRLQEKISAPTFSGSENNREVELKILTEARTLIGAQYLDDYETMNRKLSQLVEKAAVDRRHGRQLNSKTLDSRIRGNTLMLQSTMNQNIGKIKERIIDNLEIVQEDQRKYLLKLCCPDAGESTNQDILKILWLMDFQDREALLIHHPTRYKCTDVQRLLELKSRRYH